MRLIEDDDSRFGQHAHIGSAIGSPLNGKIGKKQVMVDDDDVAFKSAPPPFGDEAAIELRTLLPGTSVRPGIDFVPQSA